jgi:exopolysaccharide biosynthesis polyprenyl glycosylphosphotransferase
MDYTRRKILLNAFKLFDLCSMGICLILSTFLTSGTSGMPSFGQMTQITIKFGDLLFFAFSLCICHVVFSYLRLYYTKRFSSRKKEILDVLRATIIASSLIFILTLATSHTVIGFSTTVVFAILLSTTIIISRLIMRAVLRLARMRGRNLRHFVVVGTNERAIQFVELIRSAPELGYRFAGFADDGWVGPLSYKRESSNIACRLDNFQDFLRARVIDLVVIALPVKSMYDKAAQITSICKEQGIVVKCLSNIFDVERPNSLEDRLEDIELINLNFQRIGGYPSILKRIFDIVLSLCLLILSFPVLLATAIAIKLTSQGPFLFAQERVGLNKRRFRMYKFRTMVVDAEDKQRELECHNELCGPAFKIKNDPRVTPIGRHLRKYSLDELPQLINVLKGEMSIVGPRPLPVRDYDGFSEDWHRRRFSVRPGLTCLWQIQGRSSITFDKWMELDMEYIDRWSLWLDMKIIARTIPAVLSGAGAA